MLFGLSRESVKNSSEPLPVHANDKETVNVSKFKYINYRKVLSCVTMYTMHYEV